MSQIPPGPPGQTPNYAGPPPQQAGSGMAVAALVVGIVSIFPGCCLTSIGMIVIGVVAIVLAVMARNQIATGRGRGAGMATAGLILGVVGAGLGIIFLLIALFGGPALQEKVRQLQHQMQQQKQQSSMLISHQPKREASDWRIELQ
ncbi:MAG: hypothetical protein JWL69_1577 [Phycisphaerales bacterium]|nr:hypothetical protein [Phycisphaerales bacterium]MDB5356581.1 hypothetical protein [Phycisphaerales bacterium]